MLRLGLPCLVCLSLVPLAAGAEERDFTCFQTAAPWSPALDIGSDMAIVYGTGPTFKERLEGWREKGYRPAMMTGISWGQYEDYYVLPDGSLKEAEIQTDKSGRLRMHGNSKTVGYNVPSPGYIAYMKDRVQPAIDAEVPAMFLEEPEYWAETGWSEGFKEAWREAHGEPWEAPDSSVDAQWRASKLKYDLYYNALAEVMGHIKTQARERGFRTGCHVPTHSLINYAHWRIVSPESSLMNLDSCDGYIAQVWTGTARTPNYYAGKRSERTLETAYLEYGQMLAMVAPTGRKVWFLADPIEDNPNYSWNDYRRNYEATITASLLWPEVHHYEVMPWPNRIFRGTYPKVNMDTKSGEREGIPADYAAELLAVINALNDMDQPEVVYDAGTPGIGVVVSDSLMFQRALPHPSDASLGSFHGLALPLVKNGIPLRIAQMETFLEPGALDPFRVLLLTYEGMKPLRPEYHEALAQWVREGGGLIYVGDGEDPYHGVRAWWNGFGQNGAKAQDDLLRRLGLADAEGDAPTQVGKGWVRVARLSPAALSRSEEGPAAVLGLVGEMLGAMGHGMHVQNYLRYRRGPYIVAAVFDESRTSTPLRTTGRLVNLFDPQLRVTGEVVLEPGERALLCDLDWYRRAGLSAKVAAAACRVRNERVAEDALYFETRGPEGAAARLVALLPGPPSAVNTSPPVEVGQAWDEASGTLTLTFPNTAKNVAFTVVFSADVR